MAVLNYLKKLKATTSPEVFETVVHMVEADIKFNNVSFGRTTTYDDFIMRCMICHATLARTGDELCIN